MKVVIAGAGEVGFHIAQKLSEENQDVLLIEKDPDKLLLDISCRKMGFDLLYGLGTP